MLVSLIDEPDATTPQPGPEIVDPATITPTIVADKLAITPDEEDGNVQDGGDVEGNIEEQPEAVDLIETEDEDASERLCVDEYESIVEKLRILKKLKSLEEP